MKKRNKTWEGPTIFKKSIANILNLYYYYSGITVLHITISLFRIADHHKPNDFVTFSYKLIICLSNVKFNRNVMLVYASFSAIL